MKIAFLFLTIDNVRIPKIWEYYFKDNYDKLNIYCHPKNPEKVTIEWQKRNIINNLTNTKWGHFTNAILNLFKAALKNKDNKKFNISFVTKKKIGNAVKRNKIKRRLRNIVTEVIKKISIKLNYSYLVIAKPTMLNNEYTKIKETLLMSFKKID